jgi:hypothetical protein
VGPCEPLAAGGRGRRKVTPTDREGTGFQGLTGFKGLKRDDL